MITLTNHSNIVYLIFVVIHDRTSTDILPESFRNDKVDVMICINMIHISPFECTQSLFNLARICLKKGGFMMTYGPYKENGNMVESNQNFDESLKSRNPAWGVRDKEIVAEVEANTGFLLVDRV